METTTSLDLCFVTKNQNEQPLLLKRIILHKVPKSQHRSIVLDVGITFPRIGKPEMPRWNLQKADWRMFTKYVEENINRIKILPQNYERFVKPIKKVAHIAIPRDYRLNYIPCWTKECEILLYEYELADNEVSAIS